MLLFTVHLTLSVLCCVILALFAQCAFIVLYLVYLQYILSGDYLAPHVSIIYCTKAMENAILFYAFVDRQNNKKLSIFLLLHGR